ncbi:hypothetical protein MMC25_005119 [Agyrium rufum]|nr:hypothetical protein [Agyrium rufum]
MSVAIITASLPFVSQPSYFERITSFITWPLSAVRSRLDTLISIPALSFLILPAFSSYTTSLNLLFFYITWSTLLLSSSPLRIEIIGTFAIRTVFYILPSLGFLAFDAGLPRVAVNIKEHRELAIVTSEEHGGKRGKNAWWKIAGLSVGNVVMSVVLQAGVEYLLTEVLHVLTYTIHRYAIHDSHAVQSNYHTEYFHNLPALYGFAAHYDHPLPYLLLRFLPTYLPAVLWRFHLTTFFIYLTLISLEETFTFSGYNVLPSAFIVGGIARRQERHLMGGGLGNFGCWGLCDLAMGTSLGGDVVDDVRDEAEDKDVAGRVKGKARGAVRKKRGGASKSS